ncbi:SHOCT domain-containing protein [Isoptericola sp. NPDC057391]|uniref:SHOCT domain-containing protein n=1 Tax=Isoptericola sp. NPDC057391 TaxID=3346117 RepID=UPI00363F9CDE
MPEHTDPSPHALEDDLYASARRIRWTNDGVAALISLVPAVGAVLLLHLGAREWNLVRWECAAASCASDDFASVTPVLGGGLLLLAALMSRRATRRASFGLALAAAAGALLWGWHDAVAQHLATPDEVHLRVILGWVAVGVGLVGAVVGLARGPVSPRPETPSLAPTPAPSAPASPTAPPPPGGGDVVDRLERLDALHAAGSLTDAEYASAKARVLTGG